jgi:hypothetical protein
MARRGTWHGVQCHAMPRFRVNVARHGAWRATRGAEIFTRATPCHVFKPTRHALCPVKTWHGVAWRATPGPKKTGGAITDFEEILGQRDGRRIDAEIKGNSTRHHSNTLHDRAQGQ